MILSISALNSVAIYFFYFFSSLCCKKLMLLRAVTSLFLSMAYSFTMSQSKMRGFSFVLFVICSSVSEAVRGWKDNDGAFLSPSPGAMVCVILPTASALVHRGAYRMSLCPLRISCVTGVKILSSSVPSLAKMKKVLSPPHSFVRLCTVMCRWWQVVAVGTHASSPLLCSVPACSAHIKPSVSS